MNDSTALNKTPIQSPLSLSEHCERAVKALKDTENSHYNYDPSILGPPVVLYKNGSVIYQGCS